MTTPWDEITSAALRTPEELGAAASHLVDSMTVEEKAHAMSGDLSADQAIEVMTQYNAHVYVAGAIERLGIPGIRFTDGPRGIVVGSCTAFPVSMGRAATFDPDLEERVGDAMGVEARVRGANLFGGVCINLLRHPGWGRAQETYGEDSFLLGEMGAALVRGSQRHVMACVKHFAANSIERSRFRVDVRIDARTLRDLYLPHFRRCVDEGAASVMSAYNRVNGEWCSHHRHLLTEVLKAEWGFDGFVISDWVLGVHDAADAANGGLDLEMPWPQHFERLPELVEAGIVPEGRIDDAVQRLLRKQLAFAGIGEPERYREEVVAGDEHRTLAREVAERAIVLLRNESVAGQDGPVLPLDLDALDRVAVFGRLASEAVIGDHGSSRVRPPQVVDVLGGLTALGSGVDVLYEQGADLAQAAALAAQSDVIIVVAGTTHEDEGEFIPPAIGGDRTDLRLHAADEELILAVARANPRTVVVLLGSSAFVTEAWREEVASVLMAWYPGMEGGHAVAAVLAGDVNPGGRLPCTWPREHEDLPPFDPEADVVEYGPLHGYRLMEAERREPAFWFGHGLSYTTFEYREILIDPAEARPGEDVVVTVSVANTGARAGDEVVQLYVDEALGSSPLALGTLRGFTRVHLEPGEAEAVRFMLTGDHLDDVVQRVGRVVVSAGPSADPAGRLRRQIR